MHCHVTPKVAFPHIEDLKRGMLMILEKADKFSWMLSYCKAIK